MVFMLPFLGGIEGRNNNAVLIVRIFYILVEYICYKIYIGTKLYSGCASGGCPSNVIKDY